MLRENLQILFYIKQKKLLKNGEAPIFVRITIDFERVEFAVRKSVLPKHWDNLTKRVKGNNQVTFEVNSVLDTYERQIRSVYELLLLDGDLPTPKLIQEKLFGKKKSKHTILKVFKQHNEDAKKLLGIDFATDTVQRYETSYMHTKNFIKKYYKRDDLSFDEINHQFIKKYELFFKTDQKCSHNTTVKYIKNFKKIVRIALANGWIKSDPFKNIKFKLDEVDTVYLEEDELEILRNKELENKRIERVKDVLVFCCFTGLAFADVKSLSEIDLVDRNGKLWIIKKRQKTKQESIIPLLPGAKSLIDKYKNEPEVQERGVLLSVLTTRK